MKQLLVVSPNFPPVSAPDMQRARMSLPHFSHYGWWPSVLAVGGTDERVIEPELLKSVPADVAVVYAHPLPAQLTRLVGVGNLALRAFGQLYRAGLQMIRDRHIDLVYFSTTMFPAMALGRLWKARTGVPYVVDMQDPWVSDYLERNPAARPPKYAVARRLHRWLEPYTMREVSGVVAVSSAYHETLRRRYRGIREEMCVTVPFGAAEEDVRLARELDWRNPWFTPGSGYVNIVSVGRGGPDVQTAASILFRAFRQIEDGPGLAHPRLWFVGTDYAPGSTGRMSVAPVAEREGLTSAVVESPARIPYLQSLRLMQDADVLVVLGSDDAEYSPSKVYSYVLARRPVISVMHAGSPAVSLLRDAAVGPVATYRSAEDVEATARALAPDLAGLLRRRPESVAPRAESCQSWLAPELTRRQCELFDRVVGIERRDG